MASPRHRLLVCGLWVLALAAVAITAGIEFWPPAKQGVTEVTKSDQAAAPDSTKTKPTPKTVEPTPKTVAVPPKVESTKPPDDPVAPKAESINPVVTFAINVAIPTATAVVASRKAIVAKLEEHIKASTDPDKSARQKAAKYLVPFLRDPDVRLRRKAALALADLEGDAEGVEDSLREAVKDPDVEVRTAASQAVAKLDEIALARKNAAIQVVAKAIEKDLKAKEPEDRVKALFKIAALGAPANVIGESVIEAMQDKVVAVQTAASETLAQINPKVHPHVVAILRGPKKREAITALGQLGSEANIAIPLLLYCNDNTSFWGGGNAKDSKYHEDLFPIIAMIAPKDTRFATSVLANVAARNPRGDKTLRERRLAAISHLHAIEAKPVDKVDALLDGLTETQTLLPVIKAIEGFGIDAKFALPELKKLKTSPDEKVRTAAITAIAKIETAIAEK